MRITHELASEKDDVRLALRQHVVRLLRRRDHAHRADCNVRVRLLDRLRKRNLQKRKREKKGARATHPTSPPFFRERDGERERGTYLVTRHDGDLLRGPVAPGADVDQVDAELLQLARQQDGLLDAPLQPPPIRVLFRTLRPIRSAEPHEERSFCPRGADGLDDAEEEARTVLEGLAAVAIRARVCEGREEGV